MILAKRIHNGRKLNFLSLTLMMLLLNSLRSQVWIKVLRKHSVTSSHTIIHLITKYHITLHRSTIYNSLIIVIALLKWSLARSLHFKRRMNFSKVPLHLINFSCSLRWTHKFATLSTLKDSTSFRILPHEFSILIVRGFWTSVLCKSSLSCSCFMLFSHSLLAFYILKLLLLQKYD